MTYVKNIFDKILDFLYDYVDYVIMLAIVVIVVGIIGWRLDLIFTGESLANADPAPVVVEEDNGQADDDVDASEEENTDDAEEDQDEDTTEGETEEEPEEEPEEDSSSDVKIEIPSGTASMGVADILVENGLIDDASEFLARAGEQEAETKLRAGTFTIPSGSSIDEIIQILIR